MYNVSIKNDEILYIKVIVEMRGNNMEKSKMLLVGLGQGAGNIVDGLLSKD